MTLKIEECPHCLTAIVPKPDGSCPACQLNVNEGVSAEAPSRMARGSDKTVSRPSTVRDEIAAAPLEAIAYRIAGYVFLPLVVVLASWMASSAILGETLFCKGLSIINSGLSLSAWDCFYRIRRRSSSIWWALITPTNIAPTFCYFPFWMVGLFIVSGGISVVLEDL